MSQIFSLHTLRQECQKSFLQYTVQGLVGSYTHIFLNQDSFLDTASTSYIVKENPTVTYGSFGVVPKPLFQEILIYCTIRSRHKPGKKDDRQEY